MKFTAKLTIPILKLKIKNSAAVLDGLGRSAKTMETERLLHGRDADGGSLPRPKQGAGLVKTVAARVLGRTSEAGGGMPLNRSGQLIASITFKSSETKAVVFAGGGARSDADNRRKASRKQNRTRARVERLYSLPKKALGRQRATVSNAAIIAILSRPPRDKRAVNGGRKIYKIMGLTRADKAALNRLVEETIQVDLESIGQKVTEIG